LKIQIDIRIKKCFAFTFQYFLYFFILAHASKHVTMFIHGISVYRSSNVHRVHVRSVMYFFLCTMQYRR